MGLDSWVMGQGSSSSAQTGGQVPWCPRSRPEAGSQDLCCPHKPLWARNSFPQELLLLWMLLGLCALACLPPPLITYSFWEIFTIYSNLDIYCRLASAWFGGVGGAGKAEKELEACSLGFLRSDSASSPPASGTFLLGVL